MLTRLRYISRKLVRPVVNTLLKLGIRANHLTLLSLILLPLYVYSLTIGLSTIALTLLVIVGFLDLVDGELARARGESSPLGSFLDSFTDRVVDIIVIGSLILLEFNTLIVYSLMATSLLVSYCRAKGESLNLRVEGIGLVERAERLILLMIILILYYYVSPRYASILLVILLALSILTLVQRVIFIVGSLRR